MKTTSCNLILFNVSIVVLLVLLQGCGGVQPIGYRVTTQNVPMLEEAGEVQGHVALGINHTELIGAISPIKHIGVISSIYSNELGSSTEYGIGPYYTFRNGLKVEAYASAGRAYYFDEYGIERYGIATGSGRMTYHHSMVDFAYTKKNLQLNVGLKTDYGTFALSGKWTRAYYDHYTYLSENYSRETWSTPLRMNTYFYNSFGKTSYDLASLALTYSYKGKWIFYQTQCSLTTFVGGKMPFEPHSEFYRPILISTSVGFDINVYHARHKEAKKRRNSNTEDYKL
jgi:hypothetical protein